MVRQERAVRTRQALIRAAAEAFDRDGFSVASIITICNRAGVSSGALHFHFASKSALADAVEDEAVAVLRNIIHRPFVPELSHLQRIVDVTHDLAQAMRDDVILGAGFKLSCEATREPRTDLRSYWRRWVEEQVRESRACGELSGDVPPVRVSSAIVASTVGLWTLGTRDAGWLSAGMIAEFWRLLLPALAAEELLAELTPGEPVS